MLHSNREKNGEKCNDEFLQRQLLAFARLALHHNTEHNDSHTKCKMHPLFYTCSYHHDAIETFSFKLFQHRRRATCSKGYYFRFWFRDRYTVAARKNQHHINKYITWTCICTLIRPPQIETRWTRSADGIEGEYFWTKFCWARKSTLSISQCLVGKPYRTDIDFQIKKWGIAGTRQSIVHCRRRRSRFVNVCNVLFQFLSGSYSLLVGRLGTAWLDGGNVTSACLIDSATKKHNYHIDKYLIVRARTHTRNFTYFSSGSTAIHTASRVLDHWMPVHVVRDLALTADEIRTPVQQNQGKKCEKKRKRKA